MLCFCPRVKLIGGGGVGGAGAGGTLGGDDWSDVFGMGSQPMSGVMYLHECECLCIYIVLNETDMHRIQDTQMCKNYAE